MRSFFPIALTLAVSLADLPASAPGYEWKPWPGGSECALVLHGTQVGSWNTLTGVYRALGADGRWGPKEPRPPIQPPAGQFGVDASRISDTPSYTIGGVAVDKADALKAIGDAKIPSPKGKLRVTVIGTPAETAPVLEDIRSNPALTPYAADLIVSAYEPTHWHVAQVGFETKGKPTIYVQDDTGAVLHRQDDYADGAQGLALALTSAGRLRKPDPKYDPKADTDARRSLAVAGPPISLLVLGGLAAGAYYLTRRRP